MSIQRKNFSTRAKLTAAVIIFCLTLLFCEFISRFFVSRNFDKPFWQSQQVIWSFYPELYQLPATLDKNKINILILGGSAITDTLCHISQNLEKEFAKAGLRADIYNLSRYGHNTLDAKTKFEHCKDLDFDYVFVYNGINDARTNNCPDEVFSQDYSHIEFYSQLDIYERHPEIRYFTLPFVLDYCWDQLKIRTGWKKTIPKEYFVANWRLMAPDTVGGPANNTRVMKNIITMNQDHIIGVVQGIEGSSHRLVTIDTTWWSQGNKIKSAGTFRENLEYIYRNKAAGTKLILTDYAWYQPQDYSLQKFLYGKLDYAEQRWPTEIYGSAENVAKGILRHDMIIDSLASEHPDIIYFNFNDSVPHRGTYFNDICHLADSGQVLMGKILARQIIDDLRRRKAIK